MQVGRIKVSLQLEPSGSQLIGSIPSFPREFYKQVNRGVVSRIWLKLGGEHLRWPRLITSRGKINALKSRLGERVPSVDPAHGDLPGSHKRPEQHGRALR